MNYEFNEGVSELRVYSASDTGAMRKNNQDACLTGHLEGGGVYAVVCDGMGGASGGSIASGKACGEIGRRIEAGYRDKMTAGSVRNVLESAINSANVLVFEQAQADPCLTGMGTTVVCAVAFGSKIVIAHAGDSRAYLYSNNCIKQVTSDHSVVQDMINRGQITEDEALVHPRRNVITRALGVDDRIDIDFFEAACETGCAVLLCTDGFSNYVSKDEIADVLKNNPLSETPDIFIGLANERGGSDNITIAVIDIMEEF